MSKFVISPHMRLQEWVAEEKGYFLEEGLDYEFREAIGSKQTQEHQLGYRIGAYQTFEKGRKSDISCACHWTVNVAATNGHGKLYADAYSVAPAGIFVSPGTGIKTPDDLKRVPIAVGYQSGSHYSTIQALEQYLDRKDMNLDFSSGLLFHRMELLLEGKIPAASLFSGPYYLAEQLGFRKVIDSTFMIAAMITGDPDPQDVRRYYGALRRAQADIDLRPELYTHFYKNEFPERFHGQMDTRRWGPGERIVFEPYTRKIFQASYEWIAEREIFDPGRMGTLDYERSVFSVG